MSTTWRSWVKMNFTFWSEPRSSEKVVRRALRILAIAPNVEHQPYSRVTMTMLVGRSFATVISEGYSKGSEMRIAAGYSKS